MGRELSHHRIVFWTDPKDGNVKKDKQMIPREQKCYAPVLIFMKDKNWCV